MLTCILIRDMMVMLGRSGGVPRFALPARRERSPGPGSCPANSYHLPIRLRVYVAVIACCGTVITVPYVGAVIFVDPGNKKEAAQQLRPHVPYPDYQRTTNSLPAGAPRENDPWRFRQQSSRVISIPFWYLTSLFTSLSIGSDTGFTMANDKTCKLGGFLPMSVLALIILGA